jgi:glc operon protein GlcG
MNGSFAETSRLCRARSVTVAFLAVLAGWVPAEAGAQETKPDALTHRDTKPHSDVKDTASLFGTAAVTSARKELERIERETYVATIIETVETLKGKKIDDETRHLAEHSGIHGIFALIAKKEMTIEVLVSRAYQGALPRPRRETIRAAFIDGFRRRDFDDGLKRGVAAIGEALAAAQRAGELPAAERVSFLSGTGVATASQAGAPGPLVVRNQVRLTLAGARAMIAGAMVKAQSMQLKVNIAVVDDGGHLVAFERMDGARPASGYTAITKATTAATFRQPTGPLPAGAANPDPLLNLSLQNAAQASGGKITTLLGGVPAVVDGQVTGAIGVGGGTGEQDAQIARAGIQALVDQLALGQHAPKSPEAAENPK